MPAVCFLEDLVDGIQNVLWVPFVAFIPPTIGMLLSGHLRTTEFEIFAEPPADIRDYTTWRLVGGFGTRSSTREKATVPVVDETAPLTWTVRTPTLWEPKPRPN